MKICLKILIVVITILPGIAEYMNDQINFTILTHSELKGVASASGLSRIGEKLYVIGDDSPYLFQLNGNFEILEKIPLLPGQEIPDSIFAKKVKPDLEAIASIGNRLLIFGSGSKSPERDVLIEVELQEEPVVLSRSLTGFYENLKTRAGLSDAELNIEAAEIIGKELLLFNRGKNLILKFDLDKLYSYFNNSAEIPNPVIYSFSLPKINGIESGFSGATMHPDGETILFTATVEDTGNWIDDGEVLGSFIGVITKADLQEQVVSHSIRLISGGEALRIKVESLTVLKSTVEKEVELALVTDSDGGISEVLTGVLSWK